MRRRYGALAAAVAACALLGACSSGGSSTAGGRSASTPLTGSATTGSATGGSATGGASAGGETGATPTGGGSAGTATTSSGSSGSQVGPAEITMVMSGDVLLHEGLWANARNDAARTGRGTMDYRPLLANMRSVISSADFAICHLETPLAPPGGPFSAYPIFSVPPQILPALKWAGYDACTTMSNHSLDQGYSGIERTLRDFDRVGLAHFGTVTSKAASRQPVIVDVRGVKVGLVGATYGTNGIPLPADEPWSVPLINVKQIEAKARLAREQGAQIVIVALHWGLEYDHDPIEDQTTIADALTKDPDITFIYGHHAHVVQPYDKVNGTWVVYGLGNAVAQQSTEVEGVYDGNTARVTFSRRPDGSYEVRKLQYIPTMITPYDYADPTGHPMRWLDVPKDLNDPRYAALRPQLLATQARVRHDVNILGALRHHVTEGS